MARGGAARDFYADENWQAAVTRWMDQAVVIMLIASGTTGLVWELKTVIARGHVNKLVVSLPGGSGQQDRWARVCACFEGTDWHRSLSRADVSDTLAACFLTEGQTVLIRSSEWSRLASEAAIDVAIYSIFCHPRGCGR